MSRINVANFRHPDGTSDNISLDDSGRVGIGTTTVQAPLHIGTASAWMDIGASAGNRAKLGYDSNNLYFGSSSSTGQFIFKNNITSTDHPATSGTELLRILGGGGLTFNGDTAAVNALDDYEEGTWTPDLQFSAAKTGITYSSQTGQYTKIGNRVYYTCYFMLSSKGTSTGSAQVHGLPFTALGGSNYITAAVWMASGNWGAALPTGYVQPGASRFIIERQRADGAGNALCDNTNFTNSTEIMITGHYSVS